MTSITVGTADVRAALLSVAPHVSPDPEDGVLHRVRLAVGSAVAARRRRGGGVMTADFTADAAFAAARDTAEQAARREAERADDWDAWVEQALRLAGDHSMPLAVHEARALRLIEEEK